MDEKQVKTLKRVVKKLNALRSTLNKPERAVLDALIVHEAEVTGHAMVMGAVKSDALKSDAMKGDALKADALKADAAKADALKSDAAVTEAVIGMAATGYCIEFR